MRARPTPKVVANGRVVASEIDGEFSLYDPRSEDVHILNHTASDIWGLMDGSYSVAEVVGLLARAYGTDPASIRADVERTVDAWVEVGLVRVEPD